MLDGKAVIGMESISVFAISDSGATAHISTNPDRSGRLHQLIRHNHPDQYHRIVSEGEYPTY